MSCFLGFNCSSRSNMFLRSRFATGALQFALAYDAGSEIDTYENASQAASEPTSASALTFTSTAVSTSTMEIAGRTVPAGEALVIVGQVPASPGLRYWIDIDVTTTAGCRQQPQLELFVSGH